MFTEILGLVPQLAGVVDKAGVVGLLILACAYLAWDRNRLQKEGRRTYRQRDKARLERERYKSACVNNQIVVDVSDIDKMFQEDKDDEEEK